MSNGGRPIRRSAKCARSGFPHGSAGLSRRTRRSRKLGQPAKARIRTTGMAVHRSRLRFPAGLRRTPGSAAGTPRSQRRSRRASQNGSARPHSIGDVRPIADHGVGQDCGIAGRGVRYLRPLLLDQAHPGLQTVGLAPALSAFGKGMGRPP
jgi:hypothetical protein